MITDMHKVMWFQCFLTQNAADLNFVGKEQFMKIDNDKS